LPAGNRLYARDWAAFCRWCRKQELLALPATSGTVAAYLATCAETVGPGALRRRLAAIADQHRQAGHPFPADALEVKAVLRDLRLPNGRRRPPRPPPDQLVRMAAACQDDLAGLRDRALLLLAAAAQLGRGDLIGLDVEHIRLLRALSALAETSHLPHFFPGLEAIQEAAMSETVFLQQTSADTGLIAADRLSHLLHITRAELAVAAGLSRDAVSKSARVGSPATQARLRDIVEIINRVRVWAGSPQQAFAWYRSQPLPSFGDQTAEALVKEGRGEAVKRYLDRIAVGGYA